MENTYKILICPYCGVERSEDDYMGCCGESSAHFEWVTVDEDGEIINEGD